MPDVLIETCNGCAACCQDVRLALSSEEAAKLRRAGTNLIARLPIHYSLELDTETGDQDKPMNWSEHTDALLASANALEDPVKRAYWRDVALQAGTMKPGQGLFSIVGRCGFLLSNGKCGDYPNRPDVCHDFPMGGNECVNMRKTAGIAVPIQITPRPTASLPFTSDLL